MKAGVDTLNTSSNKLFLQGFELLASFGSLKCHISMFLFDFNISTMMKIAIFIVVFQTRQCGCIIKVDTLYTVRFRNSSCFTR